MSQTNGKIAILMSSGIDSIALFEHFAKQSYRVTPLYIQSGLRWEESELYWLKKFLRSVKYTNIEPLTTLLFPLKDTYGTHWSVTGVKVPGAKMKPGDTLLPGRNLMLLSKAAIYCAMKGIPNLTIGTNKAYPYDDGHTSFFRAAESLFERSCNASLKINTPFIEKGKEEIIYNTKAVNFDYSFSCLNPRGHQHCGDCIKCVERKKAFARAGITDKTVYYKKSTYSVGS